MSQKRSVEEGDQVQGVDEQIAYTLTTTKVGSAPTSPGVKVFDVKANFEDVTSTVMPAGSPLVAGDVITLPILKALTAGKTYRVEVQYTLSGNVLKTYFNVVAER